LNKLAPTVKRISTCAVRPPALLHEAQCSQRTARAPLYRFVPTATGLRADVRFRAPPLQARWTESSQATFNEPLTTGKVHAYFGDCTVKFARLYTSVR